MERLSRAQRERERRRTTAPGWRGDGVWCGGMRTHGEVLLQRVSKLHLQVDRKEVGRGSDSDESRVHTWTKRHGDMSMPRTIRTWEHIAANGTFSSGDPKLLESLTRAGLDRRGCKNVNKSVKKLVGFVVIIRHQQQESTNVQQKTHHRRGITNNTWEQQYTSAMTHPHSPSTWGFESFMFLEEDSLTLISHQR